MKRKSRTSLRASKLATVEQVCLAGDQFKKLVRYASKPTARPYIVGGWLADIVATAKGLK